MKIVSNMRFRTTLEINFVQKQKMFGGNMRFSFLTPEVVRAHTIHHPARVYNVAIYFTDMRVFFCRAFSYAMEIEEIDKKNVF